MNKDIKIAVTGFMGVGKSSVSRHLAHLLKCKRVDLDHVIETNEGQLIAEIIDSVGETSYRDIETKCLASVLETTDARILSLGGGTWTLERNRRLLKESGFTTVWLEATFEHCWLNIAFSRKDRPLARDKKNAFRLFEERQKLYCLADWHFNVRSGYTSYDVARHIKEEIFS